MHYYTDLAGCHDGVRFAGAHFVDHDKLTEKPDGHLQNQEMVLTLLRREVHLKDLHQLVSHARHTCGNSNFILKLCDIIKYIYNIMIINNIHL